MILFLKSFQRGILSLCFFVSYRPPQKRCSVDASWVVTSWSGPACYVTRSLAHSPVSPGLEETLGENSTPPSGGRVHTPGLGVLILRSATLTWQYKVNDTVAIRGPCHASRPYFPGRRSCPTADPPPEGPAPECRREEPASPPAPAPRQLLSPSGTRG